MLPFILLIVVSLLHNLKTLTINITHHHMDTQDLSREAYEGILLEAEKLTHDLTLQYGLLSGYCNDEAEYFEKAIQMTREIMQADDWELDDLFWENHPDKEKLNFTLQTIIANIEHIKKIHIENRHYD